MQEKALPLPPTPPRRGVFRAPAPAGFVAFHALNSLGYELAYSRRLRAAFDPAMIIMLWNVLEASDPLPGSLRVTAFLDAALPRDRRRRRVRHTREP
jgi:hypothetical protein